GAWAVRTPGSGRVAAHRSMKRVTYAGARAPARAQAGMRPGRALDGGQQGQVASASNGGRSSAGRLVMSTRPPEEDAAADPADPVSESRPLTASVTSAIS